MNSREIVIRGTDQVVAYTCGRCGVLWHDRDSAERCCEEYVCRYCGLPSERPTHSLCRELVMLMGATTRVPLHLYDGEMVVSDDSYFATEDVPDAVGQGLLRTPYVWGCTYEPLQLDIDEAMDSTLDGHWEGAEFCAVEELKAFMETWNAKQQHNGTYWPDTSTRVVLDQERLNALLLQFEFNAAMRA